MEKIKRYKKVIRWSGILSFFACFGIAFLLIISTINRLSNNDKDLLEKVPELVDKSVLERYKGIAISFLINTVILVVLSLFVKDKIEPTVWMFNVLLSGILFNTAVAVAVFVVWLLDNYIVKTVHSKYKIKLIVAKEIKNE